MKRIYLIISLLLALVFSGNLSAEEWRRVENLRGNWKFSIGDNPGWAEPGFNDSDWEEIFVPSSWENEGFHGYNGYAWYRKTFTLPEGIKGESLYLLLGYIDDVDEVYLNGKHVGSSGTFPPDYYTAYNAMRRYPVPTAFFNLRGENTIAVRVYDAMLEGGILHGDVGIYSYGEAINMDINLSGKWKFQIHDDKNIAKPDYDESKMDEIIVPGYWESQGYKDFDGFAWYRKTFDSPSYFEDESWVLVLGKIDDIDEVYLNGKKIGSTGEMYDDSFFIEFYDEYSQFRGYYLKSGDIKPGKNVVAVRVYDGYKDGGMYEGPVGLVTQREYRKYWKEKNRKKNIFDIIFGDN